jgi:hypothetical protein
MKRVLLAALSAAGCNLIDSNTFSVDYAFDPQEYSASLSGGSATVPSVACDPAASDPCATAQLQLPPGSGLTMSCDGKLKQCVATAELRLSYPIDLSSQSSFPPEAIRYGISAVTLSKVEYWVMSNTLNVTTPLIDLYVAPAAAKDESGGTKLGSVAPLSAKSSTCGDTVDAKGDDRAMGAMVCDLALTAEGKQQLSAFAKDYKTRFQILAHTIITAKPGDPVPSGGLDFFVRPVINIGILK